MNYFYKGMKLPPYIPLPKFLLQTELSLNAQMVYALLLGRSNISASEKNCDRWTDERGAVFVIYPIANLAEHLHRGLSTIKKSLLELEQAGLVERKRMGMGKPNHLYVLIPDEAGYVPDDRAEMYLQESRNISSYNGCNIGYQKSQDVSTIIKRDKNNRNTKREEKLCFGCYENIFLTQMEYDRLKSSYPTVLDNFIEQLSVYKKSSGKKYADDGATLVAWINRKNSSVKTERNYDCAEGECLI